MPRRRSRRSCSSARKSAATRPPGAPSLLRPPLQPPLAEARLPPRAASGCHRPWWPHPATAHRRQVGLDSRCQAQADGQGARLAAPARRRVRCRPVDHGVHLIFSIFVNAPLLELANFNETPNPSKAPWYFLGLQELLTMFHPWSPGDHSRYWHLLVDPGAVHRSQPVEQARAPQVRHLAHDRAPDVLVGARDDRFVLPGPRLQLHLPVGRRPVLRACTRCRRSPARTNQHGTFVPNAGVVISTRQHQLSRSKTWNSSPSSFPPSQSWRSS